jgi:4a-hydroxytetrahydrobiopterin dehydratase
MSDWKLENNTLVKTFEFTRFEDAMHFMQKAVPFINETDHHPTWSNTYNKVHVILCTHDAGNTVTEKDWILARFLDENYLYDV